jgi:hypothetical protein
MLVSAILSVAMLAFFPVVSFSMGVPMELRGNWLWILVGAIALNGIGEETLFRGFIFGHLRRARGSHRIVDIHGNTSFVVCAKSIRDCAGWHGHCPCRLIPISVSL